MSYDDWNLIPWQQWESSQTEEPIARPQRSPGKRTLTMSLPPRSTSISSSKQAPVQHKVDPASDIQRKQQSVLTQVWIDTAMRPDLHDMPVQQKNAEAVGRDQASTSLLANSGGTAMPKEVQAKMEGAFGADFSAVRIHESRQATAMGALAYTQGADIHFAPGQYDPGSQRGQELLGHELTHVVQQSHGRVRATTQAKGVGVNDDARLEREADEMGAKAARGERIRGLGADMERGAKKSDLTLLSQDDEGAVQRKVQGHVDRRSDSVDTTDEGANQDGVATKPVPVEQGMDSDPQTVKLDSTDSSVTDVPAQAKFAQAPLQMRAASAPIQMRKKPSVRINIYFKADISGEEFKQIAMKQVFGGPIKNAVWSNVKSSYKASESPVGLVVPISMLKKHRAEISKNKGIDTDASGGVKGAAERKKDFRDTASQGEKDEINKETDRRYYATTGDKPGTKITNSKEDAGKRALWLQIRDEVLFQREYAKNLPPKVQKFIKKSIYGRVMTAKDYEQLFRIGKMIEKLPADVSQDYLSKINNSTTDLSQFEASLHRHIEARAKDKTVAEDNLATSTKLAGLEEIYKKYRLWKTLIKSASGPGVGAGGIIIFRKAGTLRKKIDAAVKQQGFSSVEDFEDFIKKFEQSFAKHSQVIALNLIDKLRGALYREEQRYTKISELNPLLALIKSGKTKEELSKTYPVFQEDGLPDDKKIDLERLKKISNGAELGTYLIAKVKERQKDVSKARGRVGSDPDVIFKLDKLFPQFFLQQGIAQGSIHQMIIEDKLKEDAILKLLAGIATAIVAIALAVVSLGTAVPAIVAAGAAAAGFGLSAYMAYEEYKNYTLENDLADAGLANDPSLVWLIIAVAGAALDLGAAVKAVNAIGKGAKTLDTTKDIAAFEKLLAEARKAGKIDAKISDAVISAAKARVGYAAASDNLGQILANGKGLKNFLDPQVYVELVKMARFKAQQGVTNFTHYLLEIRKMRKTAKMGDLSPEEMLKVKQAWAEGRALAGLSDDALKGADNLVKPVKDAVMKRITGDAKFAFTHTDEELRALIAKGKAVGLSQQDIEHLVFASCRKDKPLNAIEVMNQMDFHKYLKSRGFPAKFKNMKDFDDFKVFLREQFSAIGVKTGDLRIQGSAVRSATAGDIDAAAMVSHADFNDLIKRIYGTKLKEGGTKLDITKYSHEELVKLAQRIEANPKSFNGVARSDFHFNFTNKILQPIPKKKAVYQMMDLGKMLEALQKRFPHLNIDNFTIQVRGGKYDSHPFWQL